MKERDIHDAMTAIFAVIGDFLAVVAAGFAAVWLRFDSGWLPVPFGRDPDLYTRYGKAILVVMPLYLICFGALRMYARPQQGAFVSKIPRLVRACGAGTLCTLLLNSIIKNYVAFSNGAILLGFPLMALATIIERRLLFQAEIALAKRAEPVHRVLLLGADAVAARLRKALHDDPRLRARVAGVLLTDSAPRHQDIPANAVLGVYDAQNSDSLAPLLTQDTAIDQVILAGTHNLTQNQVVDLILSCERRMLRFTMVPDLFRILTAGMEVQTVADIPLLGVSQWPLDRFWNRVLKRLEDILGATLGLLAAAPVIGICAWQIRRESPGPAFFRQERCGVRGQRFTLYKLRTMQVEAESDSGPVFTQCDDPRRTRIGAWLRRHNMDELPQLWNVLRGDMSLVGPRPERPYFVDQFKDEISRYMWRHASRPGITGWAQVNGLRGNTSISERIKFDLYYLENWSPAFDAKILMRTIFARDNAY